MQEVVHVGFMGNPNCGKTTLFNAYTGANLKVANWPGVTVEKVQGAMQFEGDLVELVDLPGLYSLTSYTMEERVSRNYILSGEVDVIVNVADASALERHLYLTLQLIELGKPVVLALNMMDIAEKRGLKIDIERLSDMLGIPVVPVSARRQAGLEVLMHTVAGRKNGDMLPDGRIMVYSNLIENKISKLQNELCRCYSGIENPRWHAVKLLEHDEEVAARYPVKLDAVLDQSYESEITTQKYDFIETIINEVLPNKAVKEEQTDAIDGLLIHPLWGFPVFLGIMALVFAVTFTLGDWLKEYMGIVLEWGGLFVGAGLESGGASPGMISLIVDGIIAGVGGILTFLPNICILFLALAFLEDSGYMARAAYVMDGLMGRLGLSGRAFIPMILGFGCTVPAIMASRTLENSKDRFRVMLITPFMSCSARLPIYLLFSQMFFQRYAMAAAYSMYVLGLFVAVAAAYVLHKWEGRESEYNLLIELPEYKAPSARTVGIYVWEKIRDYLTKAGTTIFLASIAMWFILNFGAGGYVTEIGDSYGAVLGRLLVPVFAPLGLGYWQIAVALIAGISAKEVVVSSCSVLYGVSGITTAAGMNTLAEILSGQGFTILNAYCMMVFSLLYVPCIAALAAIHRESGSLRRTALTVLVQMSIAWGVTFLIYQVGSLLL